MLVFKCESLSIDIASTSIEISRQLSDDARNVASTLFTIDDGQQDNLVKRMCNGSPCWIGELLKRCSPLITHSGIRALIHP